MENISPSSDPSNWLDSKIIECDNCHQKLYWLWHSPMYDEFFIYCTNCPKWVEASFYDKVVSTCWNDAQEGGALNKTKYFQLIEDALSSCECGGQFKFDATRHCLHCGAPLTQSEPGRDLAFPEASDETLDDNPAAIHALGRRMEQFIRKANIWKHS